MKALRTILIVLILFATIAVGVLFALQNKIPVPLDLLLYTFEPRSLALWILCAFALGGVAGMLMSSVILLRVRASLGMANRKLAKVRAESEQLRSVGPPASD